MLRRLAPLLPLFFLLTVCASKPAVKLPGNSSPAKSESFFVSTPTSNGLVFIGISGRMSNPKDTLQFALENAAQRVAMFHRVAGEYLSENNIGSGAFDYSYNVQTRLYFDQEGSKQFVEALSYNSDKDAVEIDNAFILRTTFASSLSNPIKYRPTHRKSDGKPDWVENSNIKIEGYEVGIGYAGRHSTMAATCDTSFKNAIFSIIRTVQTTARVSDMLYQATDSLFAYKTANENLIYAQASLDGFYVLDMWIDPKSKAVWTLAIAKKAGA